MSAARLGCCGGREGAASEAACAWKPYSADLEDLADLADPADLAGLAGLAGLPDLAKAQISLGPDALSACGRTVGRRVRAGGGVQPEPCGPCNPPQRRGKTRKKNRTNLSQRSEAGCLLGGPFRQAELPQTLSAVELAAVQFDRLGFEIRDSSRRGASACGGTGRGTGCGTGFRPFHKACAPALLQRRCSSALRQHA